MSDIVIRGMEMPKDNDYLLLIIQKGKVHKAISCGYISTDELNVADAVELPPHGDLIDRSKLPTKPITDYKLEGHLVVEIEDIENAPTILEASEVKV